jgi:hypothetical protein
MTIGFGMTNQSADPTLQR